MQQLSFYQTSIRNIISNRKVTYISGILGSLIIQLGMLIPMPAYEGHSKENYRPTNHFVSELGEVKVSEHAWIFNLGLILGGFVLIFFMFGLRNYVRTKTGRLASMFGLLAAISTSFVGFFPMDNIYFHQIVAFFMLFFSLLSIGFFSYYIRAKNAKSLPKWLFYPGMFSGISFALFLGAFLLSPQMLFSSEAIRTRPEIWIYPILEWIAFASILIWIVLISLAIRKVKKD